MTDKNVELLGQIYNAMANISTKGEDTLVMAECLRALAQILQSETEAAEAPAPVEAE